MKHQFLAVLSVAALGAIALPSQAAVMVTNPAQKVCQKALIAQAEQPALYDQGKFVGHVYSTIGNNIWVKSDSGETRMFTRSPWERATIGNLAGRRLVLTDVYCSKTNIDTALKILPVKAIEVPKIEFTPSTPTVPPLTPRPPVEQPAPIEQPAPVTRPDPIPQTW
jgi:cell division septation protein DedD